MTWDPCRRKAIGLYRHRTGGERFHMCKKHADMNLSWGYERIPCQCHTEAKQ